MQSSNRLYLVQDSGTGWQGPLTPGQAGTLQNTQCTLDGGASSVSAAGNNLTVNAALAFKAGFSGTKTVYLDAEDTSNKLSSGWQSLGSWTVNYPAPSISSIFPTSILATSGDTLLTVTGSSFLAQSLIEVSGIDLATTFQSSTQLTAIIPASMLQDPATVPITVMTPGPGGSVSNSKNLTITQAVTVNPSSKSVPVNWTRLFTATVSGETDQSVTWMVNDVAGGNATIGTITATGIYLAPPSIPGANVVTVKAVSVANPNKYGTATVTITYPTSDTYPRSDATSVLRSQPPLPQVPLTGSIVAVLDWTAKDADANQEDLLAVCHSLSEMGIPHIHTTDLATATGYPVVAVAGAVTQNKVNNPERDALAAYAQGGGTLLLWGTTDTGLLSRLGIPGYASTKDTTVRPVTFDPSTGDTALRYIDDAVEINLPLEYSSAGSTREYTPGTANVLATWTSGLAAVLRSDLGTGRAYVFGWRLRTVLSNAERQVIPGEEPQWTNLLVLDADIARLLVRGIYEGRTTDPRVRQFAPAGKPAALILTHDVDAATSYALMPEFLQLEQAYGVKSTYLFTTNPYSNGWVELLYSVASKQSIQYTLEQGFNVESHSFGHFHDYIQAPLGTGTEDASNYFPHYSADLGQTIGISAIGEAGVSRWLLERDFPITVSGFRTGYLQLPAGHLDSVKAAGYNRDSSYPSGLTRGYVPFVPFTVTNGVVTTYPFLEYPLGLGDSNNPSLTAETFEQVLSSWETVLRTNYKNNVPTVLLVHPVNQVKKQGLEQLFLRVSDLDLWIGDWKTFDDFWRAQGVTCSQWP